MEKKNDEIVTANADLTDEVVFTTALSEQEQLHNSTGITASTHCRGSGSGSIVSATTKLTKTNEHMLHPNQQH